MAGGMEAFPPLEINQENKVLTMLKEIFPSVEVGRSTRLVV